MKNLKQKLVYLLVSAVLLAVEITAVIIISNDRSNNVVVISDTVRPGYETTPGYARVEASPSKVWHDITHSGAIVLIIAGFVFSLLPAAVAFAFDSGNTKGGSSWIMWLAAVISAALIFGTYTYKSTSVEYETRICLDDYQQLSGNFDSLFPAVDAAKDCK